MSQDFIAKHEGETTVYTTCNCNCGSNSQCIIKAHVKDGVIVDETRPEPRNANNADWVADKMRQMA